MRGETPFALYQQGVGSRAESEVVAQESRPRSASRSVLPWNGYALRSLAVAFDSCALSLWPSGVSLPPRPRSPLSCTHPPSRACSERDCDGLRVLVLFVWCPTGRTVEFVSCRVRVWAWLAVAGHAPGFAR